MKNRSSEGNSVIKPKKFPTAKTKKLFKARKGTG
jgi:hypothetical protein